MNNSLTRRNLLYGTAGSTLSFTLMSGITNQPALAEQDTPQETGVWQGFPRLNYKSVAEIVTVAHSNEARVKELVKANPPLVNAWWDWGFGDWESPLGAASHVGQRAIAQFLLENGARMDIFAAAMLGMTDVVKAFVTAQPGIQKTLGPHGIPLLTHARLGGKQAEETFAYLQSLGDAGTGLKIVAIPAEFKDIVQGKYEFAKLNIRLEFRVNRNGQMVVDMQIGNSEKNTRFLHYAGDNEFFPAGVYQTRFRFAIENNKAKSVSLKGTGLEITAERTAS